MDSTKGHYPEVTNDLYREVSAKVQKVSCEPNNQLNICTTSVTESEAGSFKYVYPIPPPKLFITDRSNAVVLMWFSVAWFGGKVSVMFHLMILFVHYIFGSGWVSKWPPFGKEPPIFWLCVLIVFCLFVILVISHFGFKSGILVLITPVPVNCSLVTLIEPRHEKSGLCICENKDAGQLRGFSAFVFATWIVQYLYFINPKSPVSRHIQ